MPWRQRRAGSTSSADGGFCPSACAAHGDEGSSSTPIAANSQVLASQHKTRPRPSRDSHHFEKPKKHQKTLLDQTQSDASTCGEPLNCAPPPNQSRLFFFFFKSPLTTSPCFADDTGWRKHIEGPSKGSLTSPRFSEVVLLKLAT